MSEEKDQLPETSDGRSRRNRKDINYKKIHEGRLSDSDGDTEYESSHDMGENVQYEVYEDPSEELENMKKEIPRGSNGYARIDVRFPDKNDKLVQTR